MRNIINKIVIYLAKKNILIYNKFIHILYQHNHISNSLILRICLLIYLKLKHKFKRNDSLIPYDSTNISYQNIIHKLIHYDIISFDMFDTLIFRPFIHPTHIFKIIKNKYYIPFFIYKRLKAEKKIAKNTSIIPDIYQIYSYIKDNPDIEINIEIDLCYPNKIFLQVLQYLKKKNKTVIITSDMHLPRHILHTILDKCGYREYHEIFVSCDIQLSKATCELYQHIKNKYGTDKKYIHIGDNYISDVINAKIAGFDTLYFHNVNERGLYFDPIINTSMHSSIQRALKNSIPYTLLYKYNDLHIFGYCYMGLYLGKFLYTVIKQSNQNIILSPNLPYYIKMLFINILEQPAQHHLYNHYIIETYPHEKVQNKSQTLYLCVNKDAYTKLTAIITNSSVQVGINYFFKEHFYSFNKHTIFESMQLESINKLFNIFQKIHK